MCNVIPEACRANFPDQDSAHPYCVHCSKYHEVIWGAPNQNTDPVHRNRHDTQTRKELTENSERRNVKPIS